MLIEKILIVSSTEKGQDFVGELLSPFGFGDIAAAHSRSEANDYLSQVEFDFIILNAPLAEEFGHELAIELAGKTDAGIVFIVKQELADELSTNLESHGVFVVGKPVNRQFFIQMFRFLSSTRRRYLGVKKENQRLQNRLEELRIIDKAKFSIMECLVMSEPQANRYMKKMAMDRRITALQVARELLALYGRPEP